LDSLTRQQVVKILRDELTSILGRNKAPALLRSAPTILMLVGLQGSGKTGLRQAGEVVSLAPEEPASRFFDLKRPAAQDQLRMIAGRSACPSMEADREQTASPQKALKDILIQARNRGHDRSSWTRRKLHVDEELMVELRLVKDSLSRRRSFMLATP
jgi:signal recognition particle subunit SRP54